MIVLVLTFLGRIRDVNGIVTMLTRSLRLGSWLGAGAECEIHDKVVSNKSFLEWANLVSNLGLDVTGRGSHDVGPDVGSGWRLSQGQF